MEQIDKTRLNTMIEKIKETIEFNELWWNHVVEGEPMAQDEINEVKEMIQGLKYLIGEVERLEKKIVNNQN